MSVYFYIRMSSKTSSYSGLSVEAQQKSIESYFSKVQLKGNRGKDCYPDSASPGYFIDRAVSGKTALHERPAGLSLLRVLKPGDEVIFWNIERAFRSVRYFSETVERWLENDITPHFVQQRINFGTATGRLMANILASIAQYYSDIISQRIREAKQIRRAGYDIGSVDRKKRDRAEWENSDVFQFNRVNSLIRKAGGIEEIHDTGTVRIYNRVSSIDQKISGLSVGVQRERNAAYADSLLAKHPGLQLCDRLYEDESVSAFKIPFHKRPSGKMLMEDLCPGDHIVVYRTDRSFRNPGEAARLAEQIDKMGATLHLVDEGIQSNTSMGRLWITLLSVFAALESEIKRERNLEIRQNQIANGRPCGTMPRHATAVKDRNGVKRLRYSKRKMVDMAKAWFVNRVIGSNLQLTANYMLCQKSARQNIRMQTVGNPNGWGVYNTRAAVHYFESLAEELSRDVIRECVLDAMREVAEGLPAKYMRFCRADPSKKTIDLLHSWDRLGYDETPQWLHGLLPSPPQSASA